MIDISKEWTYAHNGNECFSVFAGEKFICETETEETARLICKLPELYDMVKEFIDPDLNPDFDYLYAKKFIKRVDFLCGIYE